MANRMLSIEVAYAGIKNQLIITVDVLEGSTAQQAIEVSQILKKFPEIDLTQNKIGIFSQICALSQRLKEGDRVEIYRPLLIDPKQKRFEKVNVARNIKRQR
jgi:putative ubiquitin-RnfH superfamily antitoxin RatB of RatAB toxin-antitoxin module